MKTNLLLHNQVNSWICTVTYIINSLKQYRKKWQPIGLLTVKKDEPFQIDEFKYIGPSHFDVNLEIIVFLFSISCTQRISNIYYAL